MIFSVCESHCTTQQLVNAFVATVVATVVATPTPASPAACLKDYWVHQFRYLDGTYIGYDFGVPWAQQLVGVGGHET